MASRAWFVAALFAIVIAVPVAWWLFLSEPPVEPRSDPAPAPQVVHEEEAKPVEIRLGAVEGTVEVRRGLDGGWQAGREGDVLNPSDGVRTRNGSYVFLIGGEVWEVKMESGTEVGIDQLTQSMSRLLIDYGMAKATVKGRGRHAFAIRAKNGEATASTDGGVFTMATNGMGTVALGAEAGEVEFSGSGRVVIVRAGQQSIVRPGQGPSEPAKIPSSLFLKVAMPTGKTTNKSKLTLKGDVAAGSMVEVQGAVIAVDDKGHFEVPVTLREGKNALLVHARSVGGLEATSTSSLELDTQVKAPEIDSQKLWK